MVFLLVEDERVVGMVFPGLPVVAAGAGNLREDGDLPIVRAEVFGPVMPPRPANQVACPEQSMTTSAGIERSGPSPWRMTTPRTSPSSVRIGLRARAWMSFAPFSTARSSSILSKSLRRTCHVSHS